MVRGITDVRHIPADYPLTSKQGRVARVIQSGAAERDSTAAALLNGVMSTLAYTMHQGKLCRQQQDCILIDGTIHQDRVLPITAWSLVADEQPF